jgi:hypothetical protein
MFAFPESEVLQKLLDVRFRAAGAPAFHVSNTGEKQQKLVKGQAGVQIQIFGKISNLLLGGQRSTAHVVAEHRDVPLVGRENAHEHLDQGRLPAPLRPSSAKISSPSSRLTPSTATRSP